jgi:hypothetical protein
LIAAAHLTAEGAEVAEFFGKAQQLVSLCVLCGSKKALRSSRLCGSKKLCVLRAFAVQKGGL